MSYGAFGEYFAESPTAGLGVTVEAVETTPAFYQKPLWRMASLAGTVAGAYHGYRRNNSFGWALVWGLLGGIAPVLVVPIAVAQGFGQPATQRRR